MGDGLPVGLPEGLASMAPGPELAAMLASIDRSTVGGSDATIVLRARLRQVSYENAQLLADILEVGSLPWDIADGAVTRERLDEFSIDQVAFTLGWSQWAAGAHLGLAEDLIRRLPMVYQALLAGRIDLAKARVFSDALLLVPDEQARALATELLRKAEDWTSGKLRERLRYRVLKLDPGLAKRRYQHTVTDRRVVLQPGVDDTADLKGVNLPVDRAAAAANRLDRLARAAKAAGDTRTLPQLRADAYLDLLTGVVFDVNPSRDPLTAAADDQMPDWHKEALDLEDADHAVTSDVDVWAESADMVPADVVVPTDPECAPIGAATFDVAAESRLCQCGGVQIAPRRGVVELQVKLSTLMCLDDDPALVPGFGPVIADIARQVAFDQENNPAWMWAVTDEKGHLLHRGHTKRRPNAEEQAFVKARDRTCRAPGCRRQASWCDDDHRLDYAKGGPSHRANLCSLCRHHHRLKHAKGFVIHNINAHTYLWEQPNGRMYLVLDDGTLLLAGEGVAPAPPPGYVRGIFAQTEAEAALP